MVSVKSLVAPKHVMPNIDGQIHEHVALYIFAIILPNKVGSAKELVKL